MKCIYLAECQCNVLPDANLRSVCLQPTVVLMSLEVYTYTNASEAAPPKIKSNRPIYLPAFTRSTPYGRKRWDSTDYSETTDEDGVIAGWGGII